eukprot:gene2837-3526_t
MFKNLFSKSLILIGVLFILIQNVQGSHFRFGTISWQPTTANNVMSIKVDLAFRGTYFVTRNTWNTIVPGYRITEGSINYGDGKSDSMTMTVTSVNPEEDWFTGTFVITHTYPAGVTKTYTIRYDSCCRINELLNNRGQNWYISSNINIIGYGDPNTSPVSGMLPIVPVVKGRLNTFNIIASDNEVDKGIDNQKLIFRPSSVMGKNQYNPPNFVVQENGQVDFSPSQEGLYCAQIQIYDNSGAWTVVDFILRSKTEPGTCDPSCSNGGSNCETDGDCYNCDSVQNKCAPPQPPYFVNPTPKENDPPVSFTVNQQKTINLTAVSDYASRKVFISTANVPPGAKIGQQSGTNPGSIPITWTPSVNQIGRYVVSISVKDDKDITMKGGQQSFVIIVAKPECGNGNMVNGKCECEDGWDPNDKCFSCDKDHWGPDCKPNEKCENGDPNGGSSGDGTCRCYLGWSGPACDVPISKYCVVGDPSAILTSSTTPNYPISPTSVSTYISSQPTAAALSVPFTVNSVFNLKYDMYFLVDTAPTVQRNIDDLKNNIQSFIDRMMNRNEQSNFGLGLYSDATNGFTYQNKLILGSPIVDDIRAISANVFSGTNGNSLLALKSAAANPVGWIKGSFRMIIIFVDNDYSDDSQVQSTIKTLVSNHIFPIILGIGGKTLNKWNSFVQASGSFGIYSQVGTGSDWVNKAESAVVSALSKAITRVDSDNSGFVSGVTADTSIPVSGNLAIPVSFKYPSTKPTENYPSVDISVIGYGKASIAINYNHPPVATPSQLTLYEDSPLTFQFQGTDPDVNKLNVIVTQLPDPAIGQIKYQGVAIEQGKSYPIDNQFQFVPVANKYGKTSISFKVDDGCLQSSVVTTNVEVIRVNDPPTCQDVTFTSSTENFGEFVLKGADIDSTILTASISQITNLNAYGTLKVKSDGTVVRNGEPRALSTTYKFEQTLNVRNPTTINIGFNVIDDEGLTSPTCQVTVNMIHSNEKPIVSSKSPVSTRPNVEIKLPITVTDIDSSKVTLTLVSFTQNRQFVVCGTTTPLTAGINWADLTIDSTTRAVVKDICFTPTSDAQGLNYASATFKAKDEKLESDLFTVSIDVVGSRPNIKPVPTQIPDFSLDQDTFYSQGVVIDGTDEDPEDKGKLRGIIVTRPTNGQLVKADGTTVTETQGSAPYRIYYKPKPNFYGTDTFTYNVMDTLGEVGNNALTTTITVNRVNKPPTLNIPTFTFNQYTSVESRTVKLDAYDPDYDIDTLTCTITQVPGEGSLLQTDGSTQIKNGDQLVNTTQYYIVQSNGKNKKYETEFKAKCTDGKLSTPEVTGKIIFAYQNTPPVSNDVKVQTIQAKPKEFTFNVTDLEDPPNSVYQIRLLSLPANGQLSKVDGTPITTTDGIVDYTLSYLPKDQLSDLDMNGFPLDTINYVGIDSEGLSSSLSAQVIFNVKPNNPPIYTGTDRMVTNEDTELPFVITGEPGRGGSRYSVRIVEVEGRGTYFACMLHQGACEVDSLKKGREFDGSGNYKFKYVPVKDDFGENATTIYFVLYENDAVSVEYSITISILPVNDPPAIKLLQYTVIGKTPVGFPEPLSGLISMPMDNSVQITYIVSDIDSDESKLVSTIPNPPQRGKLYNYDGNAPGFMGAQITKDSNEVFRSTDNLFSMIYVPEKGASGVGYVRMMSIFAQDPEGDTSVPAIVNVNVDTVNVPPYINVTQREYNGTVQTDVVVTGVTFDDPDSRYNNVSLTVSILNADKQPSKTSSIRLNGEFLNYCKPSEEGASLTCLGTKLLLNNLLSVVTSNHSADSNYTLHILVNDLGYNAPSYKRNESQLTATEEILLVVTPIPKDTDKTNNTTVLSAAIAGAAAGAAIVAAVVWRLLRTAAPPTDAFFGDSPFSDGAVASNPLYTESANSGNNPLYEASSN